ncbi:fimbrial protein [Salmonella enterica subsp. enterica serovar Weslaco]|nr:fimbrial protein [Salmonella enterica subsp. enterica serovar Weslaco]
MPRIIMFLFLLYCSTAFAKNSTLNITLGARLINPTCTLTVPVEFNFGNINGNDFLNGDAALRSSTVSVTASCTDTSRVDVMFIPQEGVVSGRNNAALTSNSSVIYSVSMADLGLNDVDFNTNILWLSPGTTTVRMRLASNGTLTKGAFNTAMTIQLTYT